MPVGHPLSIECMPIGTSGKNLSSKMPKPLWAKLRERASEMYGGRCGICRDTAFRLHLHESWDFFWHQDTPFTVQEWIAFATGKAWVPYEAGKRRYEVNGRSIPLQVMPDSEQQRIPSLIESGFIPYVDNQGKVRFADEAGLLPYQVLVGLVLLCPHCHSIKNLEKIRRLAETGKLDIEPVLQHYMRVNGVSREKALRQWNYARGMYRNQWMWPSVWNGAVIDWTQWVQEYDRDGNTLDTYTSMDQWIEQTKAAGLDAVSPHLFRGAQWRIDPHDGSP